MGVWGFARRMVRAVAAPLIVASALSGVSPAAAAAPACEAWTGVQPPDPGGTGNENVLAGVAVVSPCDTWAVGFFLTPGVFQTLIVHWNGASWKQVPSPNPGTNDSLDAVAATSATNVWAVGEFSNGPGTGNRTLILHWNGTSWKQVRSPHPGGPGNDSLLQGVRALSARDAWAVGDFFNGTADQTLALHWNGSSWRQVRTPNPSASHDELTSVTTVSARNAWAVGFDTRGGANQTLILHWNGSSWRQVPSPSPGGPKHDNALFAVRAASSSNAWAAGDFDTGTGRHTLVLHWNGRSWRQMTTPNPSSSDNELTGIAATSASSAWAVGRYTKGSAALTLVLHWNGSSWQHVTTPNLSSSDNELFAVGATSASNVWAVGEYNNGTAEQTFGLHCC